MIKATVYREDDGTITIAIIDMDIVENGKTKEDALTNLAVELKEYAEQYKNNFDQYYNSINRKSHYPYIKKILDQDNIERIKKLIQCENTGD